jgi:hypothetical protein
MTGKVVAAAQALVFTETEDRYGRPGLRASTAGGYADLTAAEVQTLVWTLSTWLYQRNEEDA